MALYLKKIALINVTESDALTLENVFEGVDGAAQFGYTVEAGSVQVNANQKRYINESHKLEVTVIDDQTGATRALLTEWSNTPEFQFKAAGYSDDTFFLWDTETGLTIPRQYDQIITRRALLTLTAPAGYTGTAPLSKLPAYAGGNALMLYNVLSGSNSYLNGFTQSGTLTVSQSAGVQTATVTASDGSYLVTQPILFPFSSVILTASLNVTASTAAHQLGVRFLDDALTEISVSTTGISGTGRKSTTATTPANTYAIQFYLRPFDGGVNTVSFNTPALRMGYETTFIN